MSIPAHWLAPAFHPTYARLLCMLLRARGIDVERVLAGAGLSWAELVESGRPVAFAQMRIVVLAALRLAATPTLGMELGAAVPVSAHGPVGYAAVAAKDVRQAIEVIVRYGRLRSSALDFRLLEEGTHCRFQLRESVDLGDVRIPATEAVLIVIVQLLESLVGRPIAEAEYALPYPAPPWSALYPARLKGRLRFNAPCMEILLPHSLLRTPSLTGDPQAFASACRDCEAALAEALEAGDIVQQVRTRLQGSIERMPSCEAMAAQLHMSSRTLIRKLRQQGSSYQALVDEVRKAQALWYLQHTTYPVETIAEKLGYLDTSNFSRSFRRWFGVSPRGFRQSGSTGQA
ncbi:MAG TPA: AraC family transcriptional regulator [Noviherbaspirillum sp.]|uniref:AraC family transcriptional regulator n=1 Tax=Noviherbaspirillum sp. TaxID=1926288 RepID=UPI002D282C66|nr:AraC family transcriptional regulator [Noviherbaspirillum sp.]HYD96623.1 AraC family transcriptional regulator [Noviherbaspirillum sp.]